MLHTFAKSKTSRIKNDSQQNVQISKNKNDSQQSCARRGDLRHSVAGLSLPPFPHPRPLPLPCSPRLLVPLFFHSSFLFPLSSSSFLPTPPSAFPIPFKTHTPYSLGAALIYHLGAHFTSLTALFVTLFRNKSVTKSALREVKCACPLTHQHVLTRFIILRQIVNNMRFRIFEMNPQSSSMSTMHISELVKVKTLSDPRDSEGSTAIPRV